jgi:hypothetical protein
MLVVRAVRWWRDLARLGVRLPLFVVHDFGLIYAAARDQVEIAARPGLDAALARSPELGSLLDGYRALVAEVAESDATARARSMRLGDDLVVVILARLLASRPQPAEATEPHEDRLPLDPELARDLDPQLPRLFAAFPRAAEVSSLEALARTRLHVLTLADAMDLGPLRLLHMLGSESTAAGALAQVDLLLALSDPSKGDIVRFSLELLPSVLESSRARAAGIDAAHGYAGIGRKGSTDSLVLTELAWDKEELVRRLLDGELLYYTRERADEEPRRLHQLVIDASASMYGEREVFARGLAIALGKRLQLAGDEVWVRFFDSRLYEVQRAQNRTQLPAAWLLGFKGERGRNPARVLAQLATELALLRRRDRREPVVHLITHAALRVPRQLVKDVRAHARLLGVFILPSGGALDLDWLDLLDGHAVVDHATIQQKGPRAAAASKIVGDAARL